ncbi:hypothetical protein [Paenibacillus sp. 1P07SE]|uniref:hypothetical protein n=1 Tax=Paenibacillus sp. 1P07SE TaxID=3132209 RepID=UPI0039A75535
MNIKKLKHGAALLILSAMLAACGQNDSPANQNTGATNAPVDPPVNQEQPEENNGNATDNMQDPESEEADPTGEEPDWGDEGLPPTALEASTTVLRALQNGNMDQVSSWAHKDKGVRFSPHGTIDPESDQLIDADAIADLMSDDEVRTWRSAENGADAIEMTYPDYHDQYVYDKDYGSVEPTENETQADSIGNLLDVYPADQYAFVEYYVAEDNGWSLIRLVFEKIGQDHALAAIIHDEQTS